jgi:hypothetical protein
MWSDFDHPRGLYFDNISHVLLSGEDKLVINHTLRLVFMEHRAWVDAHIHIKFRGFVDFFSMISRTVHEKAAHDALPNISVLIVLINAQLFIVYVHLYSLKQSS